MKKILARMICVLLLVTLLAATVCTASAASVVSILRCTVDGGRVRQGPSSAYPVVTSLKPGERVFYMNQMSDAFCLVRTAHGQQGYIYRGFLSPYGVARSDQIYYANGNVTAYRSPSTSSKSAGKLSPGEHVIVYRIQGNWALIKNLYGGTGFVELNRLVKVA